MRRSMHWSADQNTVIQKFQRRARRGEAVIFVPGNYDEALRDYLGISFGNINIAGEAMHVAADGH